MYPIFRKVCGCLLPILVLFSFQSRSQIKSLRVSIAQMPKVSEVRDKGAFPELILGLERVSGVKIQYEIVPFARSIEVVKKKQVDFHLPLIEPPIQKDFGFSLSTTLINRVNFVMYSNKSKPPLDLQKLDGLNIETDIAHVDYFPFKVVPSSCIKCSLKKVNMGRIDGFIFADETSDAIVRSEKLSAIRRQFYKRFNVKFVLQKGARGGPVDRFLTENMQKLRENGVWARTVGAFDREYEDWQP